MAAKNKRQEKKTVESEKETCRPFKVSKRDSDLKFRIMAETIADVFWMSTRGVGRMIYVSPAYEKVWERTRESLYRKPISFLESVHPDDRETLAATLDRYHKNGRPYTCEYRIIRKNGDVRWILERGFPVAGVFDGEQLMTGVCTDITELKQLEDQLLQTKRRFRAMLEDQTEVISRFKTDGTLLFANRALCNMFNIHADEVIGMKWQPIAHEDDLPLIEKELKKLSPETPIIQMENRVWDGDGKVRWMQFVNRGFFDEKGRLQEIQCVGRDITPLKEQDMELKAKSESLEKLNIALEVLLEHRDSQIKKMKNKIRRNFDKLIIPELNRLRKKLKSNADLTTLSLIIGNFNSLLSSRTDSLTSGEYNLTNTELKIASMIMNGMTSSEIAQHLNISSNTVAFHRKNLRKKLGIRQADANLYQHLKRHI